MLKMESNCNLKLEIELDDRLIYINKHHILMIQALWRGAVVRKQFRLVKKVYADIFQDIEHSSGLHLVWPNATLLQRPRFLKTYDYQKTLEKQLLEHEQKQIPQTNSFVPSSPNQYHLFENTEYSSHRPEAKPNHDETILQLDTSFTARNVGVSNPETDSNVARSVQLQNHFQTDFEVTDRELLESHEQSAGKGSIENINQSNKTEIKGQNSETRQFKNENSKSPEKVQDLRSSDLKDLIPNRDPDNKLQNVDIEHADTNKVQQRQQRENCDGDRDSSLTERSGALESIEEQADGGLMASRSGELQQEEMQRAFDMLKPVKSDVSPRSSRHSSLRSNTRSAGEMQSLSTPRSDLQPEFSITNEEKKNTFDGSDVQRLKGLTKEELSEQRRMVAMELLWIQQAIDSRKQYLHLKSQVTN